MKLGQIQWLKTGRLASLIFVNGTIVSAYCFTVLIKKSPGGVTHVP
jgi:hypothetical protein